MYKDIEKRREASRQWYRENKERSVALSTAWRKNNPEKYLAMRKKHYNKYKERLQIEARIRGKNYYDNVVKPRNMSNPNYHQEMLEKSRKGIMRWRNFLLKLRMEYGGKCTNCSYAKEVSILCFHHIDPKTKVAEVSTIKNQRLAREEAKKCILLCPNCHAELHLKERKAND